MMQPDFNIFLMVFNVQIGNFRKSVPLKSMEGKYSCVYLHSFAMSSYIHIKAHNTLCQGKKKNLMSLSLTCTQRFLLSNSFCMFGPPSVLLRPFYVLSSNPENMLPFGQGNLHLLQQVKYFIKLTC